MEMLIVDGYNVINDWPELIELTDNLEYARERLVSIIGEYSSFQGLQAVVVFDAHLVVGAQRSHSVAGDLAVIYTKEGETADSYIERLAYDEVRRGRRVYVVTSDGAEQIFILGAGAFRISAREFRLDVRAAQKQISQALAEREQRQRRQELGSRLSGDVLRRLDAMRQSRE